MPLSRRTAAKSAKTARPFRAACEELEPRRLLTALINGKFAGTGTQFDGGSIFEYRQAGTNTSIRISVSGNITAEFIGYNNVTNQLSDLVPDTVTMSNVYLFEIYVVKSDINSVISIAEVPDPTVTDGRPMEPFAAGVPIRINDATTGVSDLLTTPDGGAYIGAETPTALAAPANNIPIIQASQRSFGMRPASAGAMLAGLIDAPGNDLGKFFLGGTITGIVKVQGNMTEFYAGNILTGDATGLGSTDNPASDPQWPDKNFYIGGNLGNLISANGYGTITLTGPTAIEQLVYKTGFKLDVLGRLGEAFAANSFLGEAVIQNSPTVGSAGIAQQEIEVRGGTLPDDSDISYFDPQFFGSNIGLGEKTFDPRFFNDSFDTAQFVGAAFSQVLNNNTSVLLNGTLGNFGATTDVPPDLVDYYAVPLLAGQTIQVQLKDLLPVEANQNPARVRLGIFDPYGKLIETDYSKVGSRVGEAIQITASTAGAYRIAVGTQGDVNFNGVADGGEGVDFAFPHPYQLKITGVGDLAFGGLIARDDIATTDAGNRGIEVDSGDLGAVEATNGTIFSFSNPWYIPGGNFRSMVASSLGILRDTPDLIVVAGSGPDFFVPRGSVGLLRTTNTSLTTGILMVDDDVADGEFPSPNSDLRTFSSSLAVGKNIQMVDAAGNLEGDLLSNGAIGVIRAQQVGGIAASTGIPTPVWVANADRVGNDGIIDLIDVTGNLVGPAISTGPGGNVRFMHVGGTMFRDPFFGEGTPEITPFDPGTKTTITDDSGTPITITPEPFTTATGAAPATPPSISLLTYPIRYSNGGQVIVNLTVNINGTSTADAASTGVDIETGGSASASADIGEIDVNSSTGAALGVPITFDPFNRLYTLATGATTQTIDIRMHGKAPIGVWSINNGSAITYNSIVNTTSGEIVNIGSEAGTATLPDINLLQAEQIGMAYSTTGEALEGDTVITGLEYPFAQPDVTATTNPSVINPDPADQQRNLIQIGNLNEAVAADGIGNIFAQNINVFRAGTGGKTIDGIFPGVDAPIVSGTDTNTSDLTGNIVSAQIGKAILPSGSGDIGLSGIYAGGIIDSVTGGDIRGNVVAAGATTRATETNTVTNPDGTSTITTITTPTFDLGTIRLTGGSIIDANIMTTPFAEALDSSQAINVVGAGGTLTTPLNVINGIRLDGNGGIIGAYIATADMGLIQVNGGFGIINSDLFSISGSVNQGIITDGYGIRQTAVNGGADLEEVDARGNGKAVPSTAYSSSVRLGTSSQFDTFSGRAIDPFDDLNAYLGTSNAKPKRGSITNTGIIEDSTFTGSRDLGTIEAFRILNRNPKVTDPTTLLPRVTSPGDPLFPMRISFGNSIGKIVVGDAINGLELDGATLKQLSTGGDVSNALFTIGSSIGNFNVGGGLLGTADIEVNGASGTGIGSLTTKGSLFANVVVQSGDLTSLNVGGSLGSKSVYVRGNVKTFQVNGSVLTGAFVNVRHTLKKLIIGGDLQANATIEAKAIDAQVIKGQILGTIAIK